MNDDSGEPRVVAEQMGCLARRVLSVDPGGHVLAGRSRAMYLQSASGDLLWLAPRDVPMHRRGVRVSEPGLWTRPESTYRLAGTELVFGSGASADLSQARTWEPQRFAGDPGLSQGNLPAHLARVSTLLMHLPSPQGFGVFLPGITEFSSGGRLPGEAPRHDPFITRAFPAVRGIAHACRQHDLAALLAQAESLVGLGEGLTPSGDDFIGGVLFGLAMLEEACIPFRGYAREAVTSFLEKARTQTNRISYVLLSDHAAGHASEDLQRFALSVLAGRMQPGIHQAASELIGMGHSTGWSLLTGAWTAIVLVPLGAAGILRTAGPTFATAQ